METCDCTDFCFVLFFNSVSVLMRFGSPVHPSKTVLDVFYEIKENGFLGLR